MLQKAAIILGFCLLAAACVKDRQCECTNSNGTYNAGTIKATRHAAKKRCESLSTSSTKCSLK